MYFCIQSTIVSTICIPGRRNDCSSNVPRTVAAAIARDLVAAAIACDLEQQSRPCRLYSDTSALTSLLDFSECNISVVISGYMKSVRPVKKVKDVVNVTLDLMLLRIVGLVSKLKNYLHHCCKLVDRSI